MFGASRFFPCFILVLGLSGCAATKPPTPPPALPNAPRRPTSLTLPQLGASTTAAAPTATTFPVMLGIDVLESQGFAALKGKRVGLLTHPAAVNRHGVPTIEVLRRAPGVKLVALFGPEHGIYGEAPAGENVADSRDQRTGLPIYSLYGRNRKPTKRQLKGIDALVIDLQDIGVRSYTFTVCMRLAIEACFENGVEVIVLDRPNPLGGLKVDGPLLERGLRSGVGAFAVPYVHGLTIGELALMSAQAPRVLDVSETVRAKGRLTVIPMRGWRRSMRWPETGLTFVPASPNIQDFAACVGYAMVGLGTEIGGFSHGIGKQYQFRGIAYNGKPVDLVLKELEALHLPGLAFRKVSAPNKNGQPAVGIYIEVTDWDDWHPTELSFHLMRLACKWSPTNPFVHASAEKVSMFNKLVGSTEWWTALKRDGAKVNVEGFLQQWRDHDEIYQQQSRKYWLYN